MTLYGWFELCSAQYFQHIFFVFILINKGRRCFLLNIQKTVWLLYNGWSDLAVVVLSALGKSLNYIRHRNIIITYMRQGIQRTKWDWQIFLILLLISIRLSIYSHISLALYLLYIWNILPCLSILNAEIETKNNFWKHHLCLFKNSKCVLLRI